MITAAQCEEAANLLCDRAEMLGELERMKAAKHYQIEYGTLEGVAGSRLDRKGVTSPAPVTATIRKLFQAETEERIAAIDAKLLAIGVQPPLSEESA